MPIQSNCKVMCPVQAKFAKPNLKYIKMTICYYCILNHSQLVKKIMNKIQRK